MAELQDSSNCSIQTVNLTGDISPDETDQLLVEEVPADELEVSCRTKFFEGTNTSITLVVAGKPSSGKSTALNNMFDLDLEASMTAMSCTSENIKRSVKVHGVDINIFDTPGLGAEDIDQKSVLSDLTKKTKALEYVLLYCVSVSPSSSIDSLDKQIVTALQKALGKEVWKRCVILFTFSDYARDEKPEGEDYIAYLQQNANAFHSILSICDVDVKRVMTVFDYPNNERQSNCEVIDGIVAIPTCKKIVKSPDILPGILSADDNWTDVVFDEIMKKSNPEQRKSFLRAKYGVVVAETTAASSTVVGTLAGAGIGSVIGIVGGPVGVVIGLLVGGATGRGVSLTNLPLSIIIAIRKWKKKILKEEKRK